MKTLRNEFYWWWFDIKRKFLIDFCGWKEGNKNFPYLGQKCRIYKSNIPFTYEYKKELIPEFCNTEEEKRCWFRFVDEDGNYFNAFATLWKPWKE